MGKNVLPVSFCSSKSYFGFPLKIKMFLMTCPLEEYAFFCPSEDNGAGKCHAFISVVFNLMVSFDGKNRGTSCSMWWCVGTGTGTELYGAHSGIAKAFFVPWIALV